MMTAFRCLQVNGGHSPGDTPRALFTQQGASSHPIGPAEQDLCGLDHPQHQAGAGAGLVYLVEALAEELHPAVPRPGGMSNGIENIWGGVHAVAMDGEPPTGVERDTHGDRGKGVAINLIRLFEDMPSVPGCCVHTPLP